MSTENLQAELSALIERAMQQPGVAEIAYLYQSIQPSIMAAEAVAHANEPRWVASISDTSAG